MSEKPQVLAWEEPPTGRKVVMGVWAEALRPLLDRPGQWAKIKVDTRDRIGPVVTQLRQGRYRLPAGTSASDFEVVSRGTATENALYVRYVGKGAR